MSKCFLFCILFSLVSSNVLFAMDEEDGFGLPRSGLPLVTADDTADEGISQEYEDLSLYDPQDQSVLNLFESMNNIFEYHDPWGAVGFRWFGRLNGFLAENAMVPMVLYVVLNLINAPTSGWIDYTIISVFLAYLFLPSTENMALGFESFYDFLSGCCKNEPEIPLLYRQINPYPTLLTSISSKVHAGAMAIILANIFHSIEDRYKWFFWGCAVSYVVAIYGKNISFFKAGRDLEEVHLRVESTDERRTRALLNRAFRKLEENDLPLMAKSELRGLYDALKDSTKSKLHKLRLMGNKTTRTRNPMEANIQAAEEDTRLIVRRPQQNNSWSFTHQLADQLTNLVFYGSVLGEFYLYQYGTGLLCANIGITGPLAKAILSNLSASGLSIISFFLEARSVKQYYLKTFMEVFKSPYSASNKNLRRGLSIKSFAMASIIALSETYPAWQNTLAGDSVAYPLLVFMGCRHHARNAHWLQKGYDYVLIHWHLRTCGRDSCYCVKCRRGESREEMINFISTKYVKGMLSYIDQLNAQGVQEVSKAFFDEERDDGADSF